VAALPSDELRSLIARIADGDDRAWTTFIEHFAPLLFQAARSVERDADAAGDAFVHTCEHLRDRRAARLRAFDHARPGHFEIWLRAVALNLSRDARRHRLGRFRPLAALKSLPPLEQRVFRLRHELGFTFDQTLNALGHEFPGFHSRW
jgi:DNA-directed RNA polymerase specialized sigma24 family protein